MKQNLLELTTALDEAYDIRINFEQGFKNVELEALGLLDEDSQRFVAESSINLSDSLEIVAAGQNMPIPETLIDDVHNASRIITALAEDEYYQVLGKVEALKKAGVQNADDILNLVTYHNEASSKFRALQGLKNSTARSIGKRGVAGTGFVLLDIYEISLWGGAVAYGTSEKWTSWFENIFKDISNNVLGTEYTIDKPAEINYEKLDKSIKFAEKIDPFNILLGPAIDDVTTARNLNKSTADEFVTRGLADKTKVTMPGYEYAPGYRTQDYELFETHNVPSIEATEIRQGEKISKFGAFFKNSLAKYKDNNTEDMIQSNYYNSYNDSYLDLGRSIENDF